MTTIKNNLDRLLILSLIVLSLHFASCEKWLHVLPDNETEAEALFSTERGFQEALSGVYSLISEPELYGRELTFGMADVLAQQYTQLHELSPYFFTQYFELSNEKSILLSDAIWKKQFNAIANINDLLAFVDYKEPIFNSEITHSIIKGEALALRALMHFDLLRLYAPHKDAPEGDKKWIPYVKEYSKDTSESLSFDDFVTNLLKDLEEAEKLLQVDPIFTNKTLPDLYFKNRQYHINYYAVKGLLARIHMYIGGVDNRIKAFSYAKEVIDAQQSKGIFPFVEQINATNPDKNKRDRTFSTEHLFTLNIRNLQDFTNGYLTQVQGSTTLICREQVSYIFENKPDYRQQFFEKDGDMTDVPSKLWQVDPTNQFKYKMPIIRISEMYYIASETSNNLVDATNYLNTIRNARNIQEPLYNLDNESLQNEIYKEYKKEFIGEGQLYFYYKRNHAPDAGRDESGWGTQSFKYVLPMPEDEINFGGRPRI